MKKTYSKPNTISIYVDMTAPLAQSIKVEATKPSVSAEDAAGKEMNVYPGKLWEADEYDEEE